MKKIINFDKKIEFPSMIGEVTSISLDENLKFKDESNIVGNLIVKGTYKRTEASRLEEDFYYELPTEIILTEKIDISTASIEIDDFYYEIENEDSINCHIILLINGMEIVDIEEKDEEEKIELKEHKIKVEKIEEEKEERECDGDASFQEYKEEYIEPEKEIVNENKKVTEEENNDVGSLFTSLKDSEETFSTYLVYIMRKEETLESIISKYNTNKEVLEQYNDLSNITVGSKIIIPMTNEDN